jgi:hypothetical protein
MSKASVEKLRISEDVKSRSVKTGGENLFLCMSEELSTMNVSFQNKWSNKPSTLKFRSVVSNIYIEKDQIFDGQVDFTL